MASPLLSDSAELIKMVKIIANNMAQLNLAHLKQVSLSGIL
jgi:hypothetical protein